MQRNIAFYFIISLLACGFFLTFLPYPTFYVGSYNLSHNDISKINYQSESEENSLYQSQENSPCLTKLDWFECVSKIMPYNLAIKIIEVDSQSEFNILRIGGNNHADITTYSYQDKNILDTLISNQPYKKLPVLVEIMPNLWTPASLSCKEITSENQSHYCLYFSNSKAHSTNMTDVNHQKVVDYAFKKGKNLI